jgi:hypothetical protein
MKRPNLSEWASLAEIAGTVAVVMSLILVAYSLEKNTAAQSGQSANGLYDSLQRIVLVELTNRELMIVTQQGPEGLSADDDSIYKKWIGTYLEIWDRVTAREREGLIEHNVAADWHAYFEAFVKRKLNKRMWADIMWMWPNKQFQARVAAALEH